MSNYRSHQNGLNFDIISQEECHNNLKPLQLSNISNPFRCHIAFSLLFFFQIISTTLMLISLSFTVEMVSAKDFNVNATTNHSGNINNDFEEVLNRFRRLSEDKTYILTDNVAKDVCSALNYTLRFKYLDKIRLSFCDMFEVKTVIYSFLYKDNDLVNASEFMTQGATIPTEEFISTIPSQLWTFNRNSEIYASIRSTQSLIKSHFSLETDCEEILTKIIKKDLDIRESVLSFKETLIKQQCDSHLKTGRLKWRITCEACELAYKEWLCTQEFDMFNIINLPINESKENYSVLVGIKSCPIWCSKVETDCVYFTPADSNGGEPAFLCDESHYQHNARYRLNYTDDCGAFLPWKYCCYSPVLLDSFQNSSFSSNKSNCSHKQQKWLMKFINAIYQSNMSHSSTTVRTSLIESKRASSLFCQLNLIIFINSLFLYFYTYFSTIR